MRPLSFHYGKINGTPAPLIPLGLGYQGRWARVEGYVDSGSLYSLFRAELATGLGIEFEKGEKVYLQGISGAAIPAYVHEVDIQLKQFRFKGKIAFSEKLGVGFNIIGRRSFFERFEASLAKNCWSEALSRG